ncbi:MAG: U32 family peptidase [Bulleidia sp.]|nr:U32 family peptidase [Bulleidia sp.]
MQKRIELLAPAGNMDALHAAVSAGCDAVYLGGMNFGARAFAGNFSHEEMKEAVRYCHIHGVKVYVTMNTLLFESETENAVKEAEWLYHADVDALLIQDMGLFHVLHETLPDFELHCSTQMHIHNEDGCRLMKKEGAKRAVLARETPIELIRKCVQTGIDIEVFVYGAICISYSGQCLMSAAIKNRSGNRGMCAQLCRLKYTAEDKDHNQIRTDGEYLLSPKDLNLIDKVPELIEAGVSSLKIEGRMKRPEYVWLVTRTFREAIDAYYAGRKYEVSEERLTELLEMFNRGFSLGHPFHADVKDRMSHYRPNHRGIQIGTVVKYDKGRVLVKLSAPLSQHDGLRILNTPMDTGLTAVKIEKNGLLVNHADPGDLVWLDCHSKPIPRKGQPLQKTSDSALVDRIAHAILSDPRKVPVTVEYTALQDQPLKLKAWDEEGYCVETETSFLVQKALKAPFTKERMEEALSKTGNSAYEAVFSKDSVLGNVFLPVSQLNEARRVLLEQLDEARALRHPDRTESKPYAFHLNPVISDDTQLLVLGSDEPSQLPHVRHVQASGIMPVVREEDASVPENAVLSELGDLNHPLRHCIAGMTLNIANSYSLAWFLSHEGIDSVIVSSEVNDENLKKMLDSFEKRYSFVPHVYRPVYGRRTLMYIKNGFMTEKASYLRDLEGNVFPLVYEGNLAKVLEPAVLRDENMGKCSACILFSDETSAEKKAIERGIYEEISGRIQGIRS